MEPARLFELANLSVLPGWLLLILVPRWPRTQRIAGVIIPAGLAIVYIAVLASHWGDSGNSNGDSGGFGSLAGVATLFRSSWVLLGGWIHYLAFDLFIGAWQTRDALSRQVPRPILFLSLPLTFMFGPAGLLLYLAARSFKLKSIEL